MSGETETQPSGWTVDTALAHLTALMRESDKRYDQRFQAQEAATDYARQITNEFRGTLSDQAALFMPRAEAETRTGQNAEKIDALASRMDRIEAAAVGAQGQRVERRAGVQASLGAVFGAVGAGVGLILLVLAVVAALTGGAG